jgi:outer membrane protein W
MLRQFLRLAVFASVLVATPLSAQSSRTKHVEISFLAGWTFSDGVDAGAGDSMWTTVSPPIQSYDRVDPKDSFKWGLTAGFLATENEEVGFQYGLQSTRLVAGGVLGTPDREISDMKVSTYHVYFRHHWFDEKARIRPYALFGLGATIYGSSSFVGLSGSQVDNGSRTQFSTTYGAGATFSYTPNVGARAGVQWTPTYIKNEIEGYWCDPLWGCHTTVNAQVSSQWDLTGGLTFRF